MTPSSSSTRSLAAAAPLLLRGLPLAEGQPFDRAHVGGGDAVVQLVDAEGVAPWPCGRRREARRRRTPGRVVGGGRASRWCRRRSRRCARPPQAAVGGEAQEDALRALLADARGHPARRARAAIDSSPSALISTPPPRRSACARRRAEMRPRMVAPRTLTQVCLPVAKENHCSRACSSGWGPLSSGAQAVPGLRFVRVDAAVEGDEGDEVGGQGAAGAAHFGAGPPPCCRDDLQEVAVEAGVSRQLRVERRRQERALAHGDRRLRRRPRPRGRWPAPRRRRRRWSTTGARMKTAWNGSAPRAGTSMSASKLSTWRP